MDQIEGICSDYVQVKGEQTIVLKMKGMEREKDSRIVLTNTVSTERNLRTQRVPPLRRKLEKESKGPPFAICTLKRGAF